MAMVDLGAPSDIERDRARLLAEKHGPSAENYMTVELVMALENGQRQRVISALRIRRLIREEMQQEAYYRRLSDKIVAALEQALEQDRWQLAERLGPAYRAARAEEAASNFSRRAMFDNSMLATPLTS